MSIFSGNDFDGVCSSSSSTMPSSSNLNRGAMEQVGGQPMANPNVSSMMSGSSNGDGKDRFARENHSEIERRRRNKMTHYINELAEMVPQCAALGRKPDKLTILRMAVSHMKTIRELATNNSAHDPSLCKPSFLTDQELKYLILEAANGFLFVLSCDTGRVLYVADSILPVLNLSKEDWLNHSIYDLVHPDDIEKVRDQLCGSEATLNRMLDMKHGTVKKDQGGLIRMHMNCRRGFICRMRLGHLESLHRLRNRRPIFNHNGQHYAVMHCTGYVKNSPPAGVIGDFPTNTPSHNNCLVAIARLQIASMPSGNGQSDLVGGARSLINTTQFSMRVAEDGKVTYVDQRASQLLSTPVDQMLGAFWWQLAHATDEQILRNSFKQMLLGDQPLKMSCRLKTNSGSSHINCNLDAYKFLNPYSEQLEYVVASIEVLSPSSTPSEPVNSGYQLAGSTNNMLFAAPLHEGVSPNQTALPIVAMEGGGSLLNAANEDQVLLLGESQEPLYQQSSNGVWVAQTPAYLGDANQQMHLSAGRYISEFNADGQQPAWNTAPDIVCSSHTTHWGDNTNTYMP